MKSSLIQLESRGYLTDEAFEKYKHYDNIDKLIYSDSAVERTAGVRLISLKHDIRNIESLLSLLKSEKRLYTKLEICECITKYGADAVPYLIPLLGRIGNNQHKVAAAVDLNKKSYPLPRDIAARILVRIGVPVLLFIDTPSFSIDETALPELIDVIGHITFNYRDCRCEKYLIRLYREYADNELVTWKIIRAFQSFNSEEVKGIIQQIIYDSGDSIPGREALRSMKRIEERSV